MKAEWFCSFLGEALCWSDNITYLIKKSTGSERTEMHIFCLLNVWMAECIFSVCVLMAEAVKKIK